MKVNCLGCGHNVDVDESYGDYRGRVKCFGCGAILEIKTEGGKVHSVNIAAAVIPSAGSPSEPAPSETRSATEAAAATTGPAEEVVERTR